MTMLVAAALPVAVVGTAALAGYLTYLKMRVRLARQQESVAASRAWARARELVAAERTRAAEEAARSRALDELLSSLRVEERAYRRSDGGCLPGTRKPVLLEERICLHQLPLSSWSQQELTVYAGAFPPHSKRPTTPEASLKPKLIGLERR